MRKFYSLGFITLALLILTPLNSAHAGGRKPINTADLDACFRDMDPEFICKVSGHLEETGEAFYKEILVSRIQSNRFEIVMSDNGAGLQVSGVRYFIKRTALGYDPFPNLHFVCRGGETFEEVVYEIRKNESSIQRLNAECN